MKRLFTFFAMTAVLAAVSCGKEDPGKGTNTSGGTEVSDVEINEISLPVKKLTLSTDHKDGKTLQVTLDPAGASTRLLKVTLSDESVVSWSAVSDGLLFIPKKIGSTQVTIAAQSGPASTVKATVNVVSPEDYANIEIQSITLSGLDSGNELSLNLADNSGKIVGVKLDPSEAGLDMLKITESVSGIVSWQLVAGGIRFKPLKAGDTVVSIAPKAGSATIRKVSIHVLEEEEYSDYEITSIKVSSAKVELDDAGALNSAELTLTLEPSAANAEDCRVKSSDPGIVTVERIKGTKKIKLTGVIPGGAKIEISPIKGSASKVTVPVTVYGHVTAISPKKSVSEVMNGDVNYISDYFSIQTTGTLRPDANPVTYTSVDAGYFTIDSAAGKFTAKKATGASKTTSIKAVSGDVSCSVPFNIYDYPTSVEYSIIGAGATSSDGTPCIKKGYTFYIDWEILPETAKQAYASVSKVTNSSGYTSYLEVVETVPYVGKLRTQVRAVNPNNVAMAVVLNPVKYQKNNVSGKAQFYVDEYLPTDVKPGDYVYYDSATKRFNWSDGGVRTAKTYSGCSPRVEKVSKATKLGTYIGQVYNPVESTVDTWYSKLSRPGFANKNGEHARVVSAKLAHAETWKWSDDKDDLTASAGGHWSINGSAAPSQVKGWPDADKDYSYKLALYNYDIGRGSSHDVKPGYIVHWFDREMFGVAASSMDNWSAVDATYSKLGHTGWMVPSSETGHELINLYPKALHSLENADYKFWTCNQNDGSNAYYVDLVNQEVPVVSKTSNYYVRPVLWL